MPQWYQKRFHLSHSNESKIYYLDLSPERVDRYDRGFYYRNSIRRLGAKESFKEKHLYTLFFQNYPSDVIEKRFFGKIDDFGAKAVGFFSNYQVNSESGMAFQNIMRFMDAQKLRTPKGLDYIKKTTGSNDPRLVLRLMGTLWQMHVTIWSEGIWEVVNCNGHSTKFLLSDHPITTYNKGMFPRSKGCLYPLDSEIERLGTHTIFPLDLNNCLIITNLGYVRNPKVNVLRLRENPRYFEQSMFDIRKVQTGRKIPEGDVIAINHIIKTRARRYIAAADKDWLYPENHIGKAIWNKLGGKYFLMPDPRKVSFSTGIFAGNDNGPTWAQDEYGRIPDDKDIIVRKKRDKEWATFQAFKRSWESIYGKLTAEELRKLF